MDSFSTKQANPATAVWYRYPNKVIWNAVVPALVAIGAPVLPSLAGLAILFVLGLPAVKFDLGRLGPWLVCFIALGWVFLMVANVPRAYAYLQQFTLQDKGTARRTLGQETILRWEDVNFVEKIAEATFENYRWFDETFLVIKGSGASFTVYDRLDGFAEFKASVSSTCRRLSIPQFVVDRTWMTLSQLRKDDPALYRKSRRTGLRIAVERL